jgi:Putative beta-lactamase-inhibitor-like, PepSY-like
MIKTLFIALFIGGTFFISPGASAQLGSIPGAATDSFKARYPNATNVSWKNRLSNFQVNFYSDNANQEARFNRKGEWQSTEKVMKQADLPADVKDGLDKSKYYDWKVEDVFIRYIPGNPGSKTQYHIVVTGGGIGKTNLLFSDQGRLIKDNASL